MNLYPNLVPISPRSPTFTFKCYDCGESAVSSDARTTADTNGPAFRAYYCGACSDAIHRGLAMLAESD